MIALAFFLCCLILFSFMFNSSRAKHVFTLAMSSGENISLCVLDMSVGTKRALLMICLHRKHNIATKVIVFQQKTEQMNRKTVYDYI